MAAARPEPSRDITWDTAPFPFPPIPRPTHDVPAPTPAPTPAGPTADPGADGSCPLSHPVKAKLSSGIYHLPGGQNYERTKPDRCYVDAAAAEADGLARRKALIRFYWSTPATPPLRSAPPRLTRRATRAGGVRAATSAGIAAVRIAMMTAMTATAAIARTGVTV